MAFSWRVYGKETIACKLSKAELPGFFQKKITVGPQEAALIVKNGKIQDTVTQSKEVVSGFWEKIKSAFGIDTEVDVFIVDMNPLDIVIYLGQTDKISNSANAMDLGPSETKTVISTRIENGIRASGTEVMGQAQVLSPQYNISLAAQAQRDNSNLTILALSSDHEVISAECRLKLSISLNDVTLLSNLLKGRAALATWDIAALIKDELLAKVLVPRIARIKSNEFRGNQELLRTLETDTALELRKTFSVWGLLLENFVINWGITETELMDLDKKRQNREEEALAFSHGRKLAEMKRELDIKIAELDNLGQIKIAEKRDDTELGLYLAGAEVDKANIIDGKRLNIAKIDAQIREIQIEIDHKEALLRLEQRHTEVSERLDREEREYKIQQANKLVNIEAEDKEMRSMVEMQIRMATAKHERLMVERRQEIEADYKKQLTIIEHQLEVNKTNERILSQAIAAGIANADNINTLLIQSTEQVYANTSDEKVKSRSEAQSNKNILNAFIQAEDRERRHQVDMTGQSAQMMESAKQNVPHTLVQGNSITPDVHVSIPAGQPVHPNASISRCRKCNQPLLPTGKFCQECGEPVIRIENKCSCGASIEAGWKFCSICGKPISEVNN